LTGLKPALSLGYFRLPAHGHKSTGFFVVKLIFANVQQINNLHIGPLNEFNA
jgi:hypothetical protein